MYQTKRMWITVLIPCIVAALLLAGCGGAESAGNENGNANTNFNTNTNLNANGNENLNTNGNTNLNANTNANANENMATQEATQQGNGGRGALGSIPAVQTYVVLSSKLIGAMIVDTNGAQIG